MEKLSYSILEKEAVNFIENHNLMVVATAHEGRVTARTVSIINKGLTIYFQTDKNFTKYKQIQHNKNIAICIGQMQMEAIAKIGIHPLADPFFSEVYSKKHIDSFVQYSHLKDNIIIEVYPKIITFWKYNEHDRPFRDFLNIEKKEAYREYYL